MPGLFCRSVKANGNFLGAVSCPTASTYPLEGGAQWAFNVLVDCDARKVVGIEATAENLQTLCTLIGECRASGSTRAEARGDDAEHAHRCAHPCVTFDPRRNCWLAKVKKDGGATDSKGSGGAAYAKYVTRRVKTSVANSQDMAILAVEKGIAAFDGAMKAARRRRCTEKQAGYKKRSRRKASPSEGPDSSSEGGCELQSDEA